MPSASSCLSPTCSPFGQSQKRCPFVQVISREMFNPQFSLFQPVPEGGTTFQVCSYRIRLLTDAGLVLLSPVLVFTLRKGPQAVLQQALFACGQQALFACGLRPRPSASAPPPLSLPQPNPNSIIQNDEARGTNHLDFFRFVGRVVGKVSWLAWLGICCVIQNARLRQFACSAEEDVFACLRGWKGHGLAWQQGTLHCSWAPFEGRSPAVHGLPPWPPLPFSPWLAAWYRRLVGRLL